MTRGEAAPPINHQMRRLPQTVTENSIRLVVNSAQYVQTTTSSTGEETNTPVNITIGGKTVGENSTCFRLHRYEVIPTPSEGGFVVVIETCHDGKYMQLADITEGSSVSIWNQAESNLENITSTDTRLFRLTNSTSDEQKLIQNVASGLFLIADRNRSTLISQSRPLNGIFPDLMKFEFVRC